ncbi:ribosome biogenesis protein WDR12 homolog [Limulus polyphemus]|uniref:Ribosome biogenesis protein WDR12 homolog n=1 Tax=Limulus polyphemus TaxID=6850 RepID=A0ABM1BRH2_LIMPO|nr:ribosome biogenesis protein WDR12 homolog [Limulus polyphemus]
MAASTNMSSFPECQVKFYTKQVKYSLPDSIFSVPGNATSSELSDLINALLKDWSEEEWKTVEFDFIVGGQLLRLSLQELLDKKEISNETVIEIEYFERYPTPTPQDSLVHDDWVSGVQACKDWILTGCYDNTIQLWTIEGKHLLTIPGHIAPVRAVAWIEVGDPISTFVSTSHDETAVIWQWNQQTNAIECVNVCRGHARSVDCVGVDPSQGRFATGSYDHMLKVWCVGDQEDGALEANEGEGSRKRLKNDAGKNKNRTPIMTLAGHNEAITGLEWTSLEEVCTASMDNTIRLWDIELGGMKSQLTGSKAFLDISFSRLNRSLLSASTDRHIRLWDPRSKEGTVVKCVFSSHVGWVTAVDWSPVNQYHFISGSHDTLLKLWDIRSPKAPLYDMTGHEDKIMCVDWSVPSLMISGGADSHIKIFKSEVVTEDEPME